MGGLFEDLREKTKKESIIVALVFFVTVSPPSCPGFSVSLLVSRSLPIYAFTHYRLCAALTHGILS